MIANAVRSLIQEGAIQLAKDKTAVPLTRACLYAPDQTHSSYAIAAE